MIQSDNSESIHMNIKNFIDKTTNFALNRIIELFGILLLCLSFFLILSMLTYSPEDPNFIFNEKVKIDNLMGIRGSYTADFLFQAFGLIAYLIPFTFFFGGINIFRIKKIFLILENIFFNIIYIIFGSFFFSYFYAESTELMINGSGGFVGSFLTSTFFLFA